MKRLIIGAIALLSVSTGALANSLNSDLNSMALYTQCNTCSSDYSFKAAAKTAFKAKYRTSGVYQARPITVVNDATGEAVAFYVGGIKYYEYEIQRWFEEWDIETLYVSSNQGVSGKKRMYAFVEATSSISASKIDYRKTKLLSVWFPETFDYFKDNQNFSSAQSSSHGGLINSVFNSIRNDYSLTIATHGSLMENMSLAEQRKYLWPYTAINARTSDGYQFSMLLVQNQNSTLLIVLPDTVLDPDGNLVNPEELDDTGEYIAERQDKPSGGGLHPFEVMELRILAQVNFNFGTGSAYITCETDESGTPVGCRMNSAAP